MAKLVSIDYSDDFPVCVQFLLSRLVWDNCDEYYGEPESGYAPFASGYFRGARCYLELAQMYSSFSDDQYQVRIIDLARMVSIRVLGTAGTVESEMFQSGFVRAVLYYEHDLKEFGVPIYSDLRVFTAFANTFCDLPTDSAQHENQRV